MYLAEAGVLSSGSRSLSKSLCLNVAGRFCESESVVPLLQSLVTAEQLSFPNGLADPLGMEQLEL